MMLPVRWVDPSLTSRRRAQCAGAAAVKYNPRSGAGMNMANKKNSFDLIVIGAGINGAGIARDAAGRGLSVLVVEQDDIAAATSQWSTKLIHGGLRYLEHYEFRLVRESLSEREVVLHQ